MNLKRGDGYQPGQYFRHLESGTKRFQKHFKYFRWFNRDVTNPAVQDKQFVEATYFAADIILNEFYKAEKKAKSEAEYENRLKR